MKASCICILLLCAASLSGAPIENVTSSALMPGDSAIFNLDFIDPFGLPLFDVMMKALPSEAAEESTIVLDHVESDPHYLNTYAGTMHFDNPSGPIQFYGRVAADTFVITQSFFNSGDQFPPPANFYADLSQDAIGDTMPGSAGQWLDLTGSAITYSETRMYARMQNVGGGWPTSQGFTTYFIYGFIIANPDTLTLSATAMIYANIPFVLSPGLYHVDLADTSFERLGNISSQTSGNILHMACDISDITSDPNFPTWPPHSGHVIMAGFTLTITLGTPLFNDYTYPASFAPETQFLNVTSNSSPELGNIAFTQLPNISVTVQCDYSDPDNNLPVIRQLFFDRGVFDMGAFDHSYADMAQFNHTLPWPGEGYHVYFFRFSDGDQTVETEMDSIYLSPTGVIDQPLPSAFTLEQNYPNPFNSSTLIRFALQNQAQISLAVYDIAGNLIATLSDGASLPGRHEVTWGGQNSSGQPVSSGVYFYRLGIDGDRSVTKRMLLLK